MARRRFAALLPELLGRMRRGASSMPDRFASRTRTWALAALALLLGAAFHYVAFVPVHVVLALNFVAMLEPYIRWVLLFQVFSALMVLGGRFFFFPLSVYLVHRILRKAFPRGFAPPAGAHAGPGGRLPSGRWRRAGKVAGRIYLGACVLLLAAQILVAVPVAARAVGQQDGARLFGRYCGLCHSHMHPLNFNLTADEWRLAITRMTRNAKASLRIEIPPEEQDQLVGFLNAVRGYTDFRLLSSKCYRCHGPWRQFERPRTASEWSNLIDRAQRKDPLFLTERHARQILESVLRDPERVRPDAPPGSVEATRERRQESFERQCGLCHTLDIVHLDPADSRDWTPVLRRMSEKAPEALPLDEALDLKDYLLELPAGDEFRRLFPHSAMREAGHD